eukprot:m.142504 g.142504  ORF g.142504 m.142504 type:complete len:620 (+) comp16716_c0_seq2:542-2401(+)
MSSSAAAVLQDGGLVISLLTTATGCALLWHNVHGLNSTADGARADTSAIFSYVFMWVFALLVIIGRRTEAPGIMRIGLLGVAALVFLVHTQRDTMGQSWATANAYRLAYDNDVKYDFFTRSDKDSNRQLLAGTGLCFIGSAVALLACGLATGRERKFPSIGAIIALAAGGGVSVAISIYWWTHSELTSITPTLDLAQYLVYTFSGHLIAASIVLSVMLLLGLLLDVPEYVAVVAFYASTMFCRTLPLGFQLLDMLPFSSLAVGEEQETRVGVPFFYVAFLCMMVACAMYFANEFDNAKERSAGLLNYLLIIAAVLAVIPGVGMLWHQCHGLSRINSGDDHSHQDRNSNVAEAFVYIYVVLAGIGGIVANKMGKHGMLPFFMISSCAMLFGLSVSRSLFSWANGNIFREAAQEDVTITFGDEYIKKTTLTDSSANRQAAGGFVLCQVASFLGILSLVTLSSGEKQRNVVVMALAILSIMAFVACGVFEANSNEAGFQTGNIGVTANVNFFFSGAYYETLHMIAVFFFMAFFTLLGYVLGASEFVWVLIIVSATSGLQFLYFGFKVATIVRNTAGNDKDRALAAGAIGFFFSLITILASSIAGFVGSGEKQTDDYLTIAGI